MACPLAIASSYRHSWASDKHLVEALPSMYTLQCLVDNDPIQEPHAVMQAQVAQV